MCPTIDGPRTWRNHERRVLRIFSRALEMLRYEGRLDQCEDSLNRRLLFCIRKANAELAKENEGLDCPVTYEGRNQPDADDEVRASREDKRPDFQWGLTDHSEQNPLRQDKYYVVECKRSGTPRGANWVFNENYVTHGVCRFVHAEHGYGKSAPSGAMVAYIHDMAVDDILNEVNRHLNCQSMTSITLSNRGWAERGVSRLDQTLDRPEVLPTPFSLRHLWADFRTG